MRELSEYRSEFPVTRNFSFFNNAATSATPLRVAKAVSDLMLQISHEGSLHYPEWVKTVERTRSLFARLINADPSEICFVTNTSEGLSTVAGGISWKPGDKIVAAVPDFPSNVYPWMNLAHRGVETCFLQRNEGRFDIRDVKASLRPGTRLVAVSSTDFTTGFRCDLEELGNFCRQEGILFCVDAIQDLGAVPIDVKSCGISFLASGGHKWLLSTMGTGALYISKEANDLVHPIRVGWKSVENEEDFYHLELKFKADARRFEPGTLNLAGITALGTAVEMLLEIGIERIFERICGLNDIIASELGKRNLRVISPMEPRHRSGILSFEAEDAGKLFRYLLTKKVVASQRGNGLRLSPHFYIDESDIERLFEALDSYRSI
ncbi:MAG TPA: aminotransferase class V-fold PLP-dependent enzyme [Syntrophobacteraceae bacterium]|nr:aminotransferase class V-fold PLP-dependent enzyme [Syntrophobacteraceae bacterium]